MRAHPEAHAMSLRSLTLLAGGVIALPLSAAAQVKLEVTPHFASYYATNELSFVDADNLERQEAGPGIGSSLTWRLNNIWAVEGQATFIHSGVVVRNTGFQNFQPPTDGHLLMVTARVLFQPRRTNIYFALGAGTTRRGGDAFDVPGIDDKSDYSMIVGFGVRARVSSTWGFRIGAEMHLYETDPDRALAYYQKRMQRDVLVTIGVPIALIGR